MLGEFIGLAPTPDSFPYITTAGAGAMAPISVPARQALAYPTKSAIINFLGGIGADSPAFSGAPTAPTPTAGDNSERLSTTAFVKTAIAALVAASPAALDTLTELAAAIGNDASFSATISASLGFRLRFDAAQSLTSGQKTQAQANLGLGTAAPLNVGTGANQIVQLDGTGKLPALNASLLTNLPNGAAGAGYGGTSATSLTPATGSKAFTTQTGMAYAAGSRARATSASAPGVWMEGVVSSYASGVLTINVDLIGAATLKADWNLAISGERGSQGAAGTNGTNGSNGAQGPQGVAGPQGGQGPQGIQGPAGTFPIGAGVVGGYALGDTDNHPASAFGGSWLLINTNAVGSYLYQRYA